MMYRHRIVANLIACAVMLVFAAACSPKTPAQESTDPTLSGPAQDAAEDSEPVEPQPESEETTVTTTVVPTTTQTSADTVLSFPLLQLDLPPEWTARLVDPAQAVSLPIPEGDDVMALTAVRTVDDNAGIKPTLLAMQYPRHDLDLETYLAGVTGVLGERAEVRRAGIVYDLREDGKPVGILAYGNETVAGYQIVQFDANGDNLILLTFTVPEAELDNYVDEFIRIAADIDSR